MTIIVIVLRISFFVEAVDQPEKEEERRSAIAVVELQVCVPLVDVCKTNDPSVPRMATLPLSPPPRRVRSFMRVKFALLGEEDGAQREGPLS
jgi:hypothetical protein